MNPAQQMNLILQMAIEFDESIFRNDVERQEAARVMLSEIREATKSVIELDYDSTVLDLDNEDTISAPCISFDQTKGQRTKGQIYVDPNAATILSG